MTTNSKLVVFLHIFHWSHLPLTVRLITFYYPRYTSMAANKATQTHCYNPVAQAYSIWAYYAHGWQCKCQEDPVSLPSGRLEKTTRSSPHLVAQHRPTGSETTPPYAPPKQQIWLRTALYGGWCRHMALRNPELHARNDDDDDTLVWQGADYDWLFSVGLEFPAGQLAESRLLAGTVSDNLWRCFCLQRTDAFSALVVSRRCAI